MFERSPTATIKVKKAEKSLLDVSNSSAATDGSVKKLLQFFLVFNNTAYHLELSYSQTQNCKLCAIYHPARGHDQIPSLQFFQSRILSHDFCHIHHS